VRLQNREAAASSLAGLSIVALAVIALTTLTASPSVGQEPPGRLSHLSFDTLLRGPGSWIGVTFREVTPIEADKWRLAPGGAVIKNVTQGGPAWRMSLRAGDIVTKFDGLVVGSASELSGWIRDTPPGWTVTATIVREGAAWDLAITPDADPAFRRGTHATPCRQKPTADSRGRRAGDRGAARDRPPRGEPQA
jgi:S1-C subfamily serine protease